MPVSGAWSPAGDGEHCFIVGPRVFEDAGVGIGGRVEMRFGNADQAAGDVPKHSRGHWPALPKRPLQGGGGADPRQAARLGASGP